MWHMDNGHVLHDGHAFVALRDYLSECITYKKCQGYLEICWMYKHFAIYSELLRWPDEIVQQAVFLTPLIYTLYFLKQKVDFIYECI